MVGSYKREIETLVTENQSLKQQNRILQIQCSSLVRDIVELFHDTFSSIPQYDQQNLDDAVKQISLFYRMNLATLKENAKLFINRRMADIEAGQHCEQKEQIDPYFQSIVRTALDNYVNAKQQVDEKEQEIAEHVSKQAELEARVSQLTYQIEQIKDELFNQRQICNEISHQLKNHEAQTYSLSGKLMRRNNEYELLEQQHQEIKEELEFMQLKMNKLMEEQ